METSPELEALLDAVHTLIYSATNYPEDQYATEESLIFTEYLHEIMRAYSSFNNKE